MSVLGGFRWGDREVGRYRRDAGRLVREGKSRGEYLPPEEGELTRGQREFLGMLSPEERAAFDALSAPMRGLILAGFLHGIDRVALSVAAQAIPRPQAAPTQDATARETAPPGLFCTEPGGAAEQAISPVGNQDITT